MLLTALATRRLVFFGGKGGTGKTTLASAFAVASAKCGRRVLLVSTDPAHNLAHLFDRPVGPRSVQLGERLEALELDPDATVDSQLRDTRGFLEKLMPERLHSEVARHLEQSRHAPGMVEAALLESMAVTIESTRDSHDLVVFDTAPSGHTARLMALPEMMSAWTEGLLAGRERSERFARARAVIGGVDEQQDQRDSRIRQVLDRRRQRFAALRSALTNANDTAFVIVANADRLSVLETVELHAQLKSAGVTVPAILVNKRLPVGDSDTLVRLAGLESEPLAELDRRLPHTPRADIPLVTERLVGWSALERFAESLAGTAFADP